MAHISRHLVTASGSLSVGREDDCRKPIHQRPVSGKNCGHINKVPRSVMVLYDGELPGAYFGSWGKGKRATAVWKTTDSHNLLPTTRKSRACDLCEEICSEFPFLCKRMIYTHKSSFPQIPTLIPLFSKNWWDWVLKGNIFFATTSQFLKELKRGNWEINTLNFKALWGRHSGVTTSHLDEGAFVPCREPSGDAQGHP